MGINPWLLKKITLGGLAALALGITGLNAIAADTGFDGRQVEEFRAWRNERGGAQCRNVDSSWNGEPLARVLFCTKDSNEDSDSLTSLVYGIMTTRDPAGWLNPYWITARVSTASYGYTGEIEGTVVGKYYDSYYAAWESFVSMLRSEFSQRDDIKWWGVTKGTCFDDATYREFKYNCTHVSEIAEAKDGYYRDMQGEKKAVKKPAKPAKGKRKKAQSEAAK